MSEEFDVSADELKLEWIETQTRESFEILHEERAIVEDALRIARDSISKTERRDPMKPSKKTAGAEIIALKKAVT